MKKESEFGMALESIIDDDPAARMFVNAMNEKRMLTYTEAKYFIQAVGNKNMKIMTMEDYAKFQKIWKDVLPENPQEYYTHNK